MTHAAQGTSYSCRGRRANIHTIFKKSYYPPSKEIRQCLDARGSTIFLQENGLPSTILACSVNDSRVLFYITLFTSTRICIFEKWAETTRAHICCCDKRYKLAFLESRKKLESGEKSRNVGSCQAHCHGRTSL